MRLTENEARALSAYADGNWRSSVAAAETLLLSKYAHGNFGQTVRRLMLSDLLRFNVNAKKVGIYQITDLGRQALGRSND